MHLIFRDALTSLTVLWKMRQTGPGGFFSYLICVVQCGRCIEAPAHERSLGVKAETTPF